jgi:exosortase/archaeosortase family protein
MKIRLNKRNTFLIYLLKFGLAFCICYYGTIAIIGLSAPGGYYSDIIHKYFNYISVLRASLLHGSKEALSIFNFDTYVSGKYVLKVRNGPGVKVVYACLGYGVMSFWIAFITANRGNVLKKLTWIFGGLFLIWLINITRISLLLAATTRRWYMPAWLNHHTLFNIAAYLLIFALIYFYDKSGRFKTLPKAK